MGDLSNLKEQEIWMPDYLQREIGRFNIFPIHNTPGNFIDCQPYNRKGFYKISLLSGHMHLYYADKNLEFKDNALLFSNPNIPYSWDHIGDEQTGYYCVFTEKFFDDRQSIRDYPVFKPGNIPLFELTANDVVKVRAIFEKMEQEIKSDFEYKYDVIRNLTLDLIYLALKMKPAEITLGQESKGAERVALIFTELLERQFPIESVSQRVGLRFPAEFAEHLSIHINHLNRSLKKVTGKTTSQLIAERLIQEARILLQHTNWNITEIGRSLGFDDLPHFINFFKKGEAATPKSFRNNC